MKLTLDTIARFTWDFGMKFLLEVEHEGKIHYFVWNDPDYYGDNTIQPFTGNPRNFVSKGFMGRDKGEHTIRGYCGEDVRFIGC